MNTNYKSGFRAVIGLATAVMAFAPLCGHADASVQHRVLLYTPTDANTVAGARVLYKRLQHAADGVCTTNDSRADFANARAIDICRKDAIAGAVRSVNSPLLSQVFVEQNGSVVAMQYGVGNTVLTAQK